MNVHTKRFVFSALVYFFIGCALGVLSVARPDLIPTIRPIHTHINLLGWVSMMIIGVSYFVIPVFLKKAPYSERAITLHFILANLGIIGMSIALIDLQMTLLAISAVIEALSAYLFLFNIISTAIKGRPLDEIPSVGRFLTGENDGEVDKWASSFTQAATFYFVGGCTLGAYIALSPAGWGYLRIHFHVNLLGWVTMMIYGVAYHIFPRFSGNPVRVVSLVRTNYIIANAGLLLMIAALVYSEMAGDTPLAGFMVAFAGVVEGIAGVIFVYNILPSVADAAQTMGKASVRFVSASLSYLIIGIAFGLLMALSPDYAVRFMPVHAHLNVLGWITMMIYGVGYYIIPQFAGKRLYSQGLAMTQFWIANIGLIGMLVLFPFRAGTPEATITIFASMEFLAALIFLYNIARSILPKD